MSSQNVETVRRSFEGWNRGDVDAWLEAAHPEVEWTSEIVQRVEGAEAVFRGTDEMRRYWDEWHSVRDVAFVFEFEDGMARRARACLDPQQAIRAAGRAGD